MNTAPRHATVLAALPLLALLAILALEGCAPKYPECSTDKDCVAHKERCVQGMCRGCADDSDCGVNDPCQHCGPGWVCQRAPDCCSSVLDCPAGTYCQTPEYGVAGRCVQGCARDADCGPGKLCIDGRCDAWCQCADDAACGAGARCVDCRCQATDAGCTPTAVYFDYDEAYVNQAARASLGFSAACLTERGTPAQLVGHADERGTLPYNDRLALRRAESVRRELQALGVKTPLEVRSAGKRQPVCQESSESCWRQNRRVDIVR